MLIGLARFSGGELTTLSGTQIFSGVGLPRVLAVSVYIAVCLSFLGAVGLFVSALTERPMAATMATLSFSAASLILDAIPQVLWLHPYLITHLWMDSRDLVRTPVLWSSIDDGLHLAAAYAVVFCLAAWARFSGKGMTS